MKTTVDNKCPSCGANIKFDPTSQKWKCEYCGMSYEVDTFEKQQSKESNEDVAMFEMQQRIKILDKEGGILSPS